MVNRVGITAIYWYVKVALKYGTNFTTNMSSKWFTQQYIITGEMPSSTRAAQFEYYKVDYEIFNVVTFVTNYINQNVHFLVTGWDKRGEVKDQGGDQLNNGLPYN